jgi:hypothetical protein
MKSIFVIEVGGEQEKMDLMSGRQWNKLEKILLQSFTVCYEALRRIIGIPDSLSNVRLPRSFTIIPCNYMI